MSAGGYKGPDAAAGRHRVLGQIRSAWTLNVDEERLLASDDALDAALCVLAGADFLRGHCLPPEAADRERAQAEGWIWFMAPPA